MKTFFLVLALVLNFAGTFLLFLSFQATSSDFRFVTIHDVKMDGKFKMGGTTYAICAGHTEMAAADDNGAIGLGMGNCSVFDKGKPAAVVIAEYPLLVLLGFGLMALGFLIQIITTIPWRRAAAAA